MNELFAASESAVVTSNRILYTASPFARLSLLHLQEIGELHALKPHESKRSGLNSFLFITILSGSGELSYDGTIYELQPHSCVFIDCSVPYSHSTSDDLWQLKWIHFTGPMMRSVYAKYRERGGRPVFCADNDYNILVDDVWDKLFSMARSDSYMRDMLINQYLSSLLTLLMEQSWHPENQTPAPKRQSITEIRKYLEEHYNEKISLDDLSARFFIDKYYMTKSFKEQYGVNINAYQSELRVTKAKELLRFSGRSIEEISDAIGMSSPEYFYRVFKKVEGMSPSEYRKQW